MDATSGQVENLKNKIEAQNRKKDALESHVAEAEKKAQDMSLKLERVSTIYFSFFFFLIAS